MRWVTFYLALNVPIDVRGVMTSKEVDVDVVETGAPSAQASSVRARVSDAMPLIGLNLAVILNAASIGFLTYCVPSSSRDDYRQNQRRGPALL